MLINFNHIKTFYNALIQRMKGFRGNWEQNDDTADDYIKNRTHWSEGIKEVETVLVNNLTANVYSDNNPYKCNFMPGQSYAVTWNGTLYKNIICYFVDGFNVLGDDDYPFYIDDDGGDGLYVFSDDDNWTLSISIVEKEEIVHKLDKKIIDMPDNLVTKEFLEDNLDNVAFSGDYGDLSNTPHVDNFLSGTSYNAVTNSAVTNALNRKVDIAGLQLPVATTWQKVAYGNGRYVAIAGGITQTDVYAYSDDGITWTQGTLPKKDYWTGICFGKTKFIITAGSNINRHLSASSAMSSDGINWSLETLPQEGYWTSVCYGNNKFVAVSQSGTNSWVYKTEQSDDWQLCRHVDGSMANFFSDVCYGNNMFLAIGATSTISYSYDGIDWYTKNCSSDFSSGLSSICYGKDKFVACGGNSQGRGELYYSTDGFEWHSCTAKTKLVSVCYGNGRFVAISGETMASSTSIYSKVMVSLDGKDWSEVTLPISGYWRHIGYSEEQKIFMAISGGIQSSSSIILSTDGVTWTAQYFQKDNQSSNELFDSILSLYYPKNAVLHTPQDLTSIQKEQIRTNIGLTANGIKADSEGNIALIGADWTQNDETQLDYIKNKPCNKIVTKGEIIIPESTIESLSALSSSYNDMTIYYGFGSVSYSECPDLLSRVGEDCEVTINGVTYQGKLGTANSTATSGDGHRILVYYIGNIDLTSYNYKPTYRDSTKDFCVVITNLNISYQLYTLNNYNDAVSVMMKFSDVVEYIPLEEHYIPNTIARTDEVNSSIDSHNTATDSHSDIRELIQSIDDNKADKTELPTSLPNPNALTINGTTYDGSTAVDITDAVVNAVLNALPTWNGGDY